MLTLQDIDNKTVAHSYQLVTLWVGVLPSTVVRGRKNPLYYGLPHRLKKARTASYDAVASAAGLPDGITVYLLEQGKRVPRLDTVEKIACALGVSPSFLAFGLAGECARGQVLHSEGVGARLRAARNLRVLTVRGLARLSAMSDTTVRLTENGETVPSVATVEALARALNVSPGWLGYGIGPQTLPARRGAGTAQTAADS